MRGGSRFGWGEAGGGTIRTFSVTKAIWENYGEAVAV